MTRKEFLSKLSIGAAFALTVPCISSCSKDQAPPPRDLDFDVNLQDPEYANLLNNGGFVVIDGVVIARSLSGEYIAATVKCSHDMYDQIEYQNGEWFCTKHGARFTEEGVGLNAFGNNDLFVYNVDVIDANTIRVYN